MKLYRLQEQGYVISTGKRNHRRWVSDGVWGKAHPARHFGLTAKGKTVVEDTFLHLIELFTDYKSLEKMNLVDKPKAKPPKRSKPTAAVSVESDEVEESASTTV